MGSRVVLGDDGQLRVVDGDHVYRVLGDEVNSWVMGELKRFAFTGSSSGRPPSPGELAEATHHSPFMVETKDPWTLGQLNGPTARHNPTAG